jgi:hypothetical protein
MQIATRTQFALSAWCSGHRLRQRNRRLWVRISPGCMFFRYLYIAINKKEKHIQAKGAPDLKHLKRQSRSEARKGTDHIFRRKIHRVGQKCDQVDS